MLQQICKTDYKSSGDVQTRDLLLGPSAESL